MTTTSDLAATDIDFSKWLKLVQSRFEQPEEFELAQEIFSFAAAYENGSTPQEAYDSFDEWTRF